MLRGEFLALLLVPTIMLCHSPALALDGNDWRGLSENSRTSYVVGVVDVWNGLAFTGRALKKADPSSKERWRKWFIRSPNVWPGKHTAR
jgi:hypothetical protein